MCWGLGGGVRYARACGLTVVDPTKARAALAQVSPAMRAASFYVVLTLTLITTLTPTLARPQVYVSNVRGFGGGRRGAVNGMRPNGRVDNSSMQSREVLALDIKK